MKSICLVLLICLYAFGSAVNSQALGYGLLTPYNIYTIDNANNNQYKEILSPQPQNILAFLGLANNASYSYDAIYSNSQDTITLGLINYISGAITDLYTVDVPFPFKTDNIIDSFGFLGINNTLYYLASAPTINNNQISLITTKISSSSGSTVVLPVFTTNSSNTLGAFDQSSGIDYFIVTTGEYNQFICYWINTVTNKVIKQITISNVIAGPVFKIFGYNRSLYIVQSDISGKYVHTYLVDWVKKTMLLANHILVPSQPIDIQVYQSSSYYAIFSLGLGDTTPTVPLVDLSTYTVSDYLVGLPVSNQNTYFFF